jgi:hypothetical protein
MVASKFHGVFSGWENGQSEKQILDGRRKIPNFLLSSLASRTG